MNRIINVAFKSCSEAFETTTSAGRLMINFLASIGEFERETIVDNVKMGMKQRARTGKWNGGIVLSYKSVIVNENDTMNNKEGESSDDEVLLLFQFLLSGYSYKKQTNIIWNIMSII